MNRSKKEIILLSQYFYPDIASTGLLMTDICVGLAENGFSVKVYTAKPHYGNKIKASTDENYKGITIKRLFSLKLNKNKKIFNILNSVSYFISVFLFLNFKNENGTFMVVTNPPYLSVVGLFVKFFKGNDFIYIIHDLFPDAGITLGLFGKNSLIARMWELVNRSIFRMSKGIVVLGETMYKTIENKVNRFEAKTGNAESVINKIHIIHNWAGGDLCAEIKKDENPYFDLFNIRGKFVAMYSGNISVDYRLDLILETAKDFIGTNVEFLLVGNGNHKNKLIDLKEKMKLKNVHFFPFQNLSDMKFSLNAADVLILSSKADFEGISVPSKLYTYMAAGRTIIAFAKRNSEIDEILKSAKCGFCFDYSEVKNFKEIIIFLSKNPNRVKEYSANARTYYINNFSFNKALSKYINIFNTIQNTN